MGSDVGSIADGWVREYSPPNRDLPEGSKAFEYYDKLADLVADEPAIAFEVILAIIQLTADDFVISNLAAGPLEDLIARHGSTMIDRIESEARSNDQLRFVLRGVWKNLSNDEIWKRIEQVRSIP